MPVQSAPAPFTLEQPIGLKLVQLDEYPFEVRRPRFQYLLEQVARFRQIHSIYSEIKAMCGLSIIAHDVIENLW